MFRTFSNLFKNPKTQINHFIKFNFITQKTKSLRKKNLDIAENPEIVDITDKYQNIKVFQGKFPYMPIDDHPLIPGYTRMLSLSRDLFERIRETNPEQNQLVISVCKNPEQIEGVQLSMQQLPINFVPNIKGRKDVYEFGCLCEIKLREEKNIGQGIIIKPLSICKIIDFTIEPTPVGEVEAIIYKEDNLTELDVDMEMGVKYQYLKSLLTKAIETSKDENFRRLILAYSQNFDTTILNQLIYMCLSCLTLPRFLYKYGFLLAQFKSSNLQEIIEVIDIREKLNLTTNIFSEFTNKIELWEKLEDEYDINREKTKATEKLQSIYESLKKLFETDKDEKKIQVDRFKKNLEGKNIPAHIMTIFKEELERFYSMDKHSMESNVIRNYLDILTSLPYGISTHENLDILTAKNLLNETHYGMDGVKDRILECIAVGKLKGKIQGKILCFVGPPGVGKTSIGESIARALNRKFIRISLGGDRDTSSLKGHRRTYVGAIPGKIVKALKTAGSENPVILLDEIDKLGERSVQGDPSSVLLEILDPEQNCSFTDDYLDTPIDLSKVFFICTANNLSNIQQPLYDRMEIIEVSGYTFNEKKFIFQKYLQPKAIVNSGLDNISSRVVTDENNVVREPRFSVEEKTIEKLINDYCRESGVRSLQRFTNRIYEKGVSIGLGFNNYGGTIMYVEASKANFSDKVTGQFNITGNVGKVMGESCTIALTYSKYFINRILIKFSEENPNIKTFFDENHIHIHFSEGAISKDGPSAGVAITTALISLALNKPIVQDLAMTGEISLGGKVLTIGGVKEKVMAAQREGMKTLIFPRRNKDDIDELPEYITQGMEIFYADEYMDVFKICFPNMEISV